ncbi:MAG TPA: hypothetical protein VN796_05315 [Acidimicrobiales bacterium]|nr:hypothetical protein [Acidimicrobiales bacterium]
MIRRAVLVMGAVVVSLLVIPVGVASARLLVRSDPVATGVTNCGGAWTGTLKFTPPLINGGTSTSEEISLKATAKPCAGGTPPPVKGKINGKGVIFGTGANNCATVFAGGTFSFSTAQFVEVIKWNPTSISPSRASFPSVTEGNVVDAPYVNFFFNVGVIAGSYSPFATTQSITTVKTLATITGPADCGSTGGVASLAIRGAQSTGSY